MNEPDLPPQTSYPAPPWRAEGQMWTATVTAVGPPPVPPDLTLVGNPRRLVIALARFNGTLCYDEIAVGSLVRRRGLVGLWCHRVWVDDAASLWGGRQLWGIPKELARFDWDGSTVSVTSGVEPLASFSLGPPGRRLPPLPVPVTGFGLAGDRRMFLPGRVLARFALTSIRITGWSPLLPGLGGGQSALRAVVAVSARFRFPVGRDLGRAADFPRSPDARPALQEDR
jgi:hypothetical protein